MACEQRFLYMEELHTGEEGSKTMATDTSLMRKRLRALGKSLQRVRNRRANVSPRRGVRTYAVSRKLRSGAHQA